MVVIVGSGMLRQPSYAEGNPLRDASESPFVCLVCGLPHAAWAEECGYEVAVCHNPCTGKITHRLNRRPDGGILPMPENAVQTVGPCSGRVVSRAEYERIRLLNRKQNEAWKRTLMTWQLRLRSQPVQLL